MPVTGCLNLVAPTKARLTRLDIDGTPITGAKQAIEFCDLLSINMQADIEEGEESIVKLANGRPCFMLKRPSFIKRFTIELNACKFTAQILELVGNTLIGTGEGTGVLLGGTNPCSSTEHPMVAVEFWVEMRDCNSPILQYAYICLPAAMLDWTGGEFGSDNVPLQIRGYSLANPNWVQGPWTNGASVDLGSSLGAIEFVDITHIGDCPTTCVYATVPGP